MTTRVVITGTGAVCALGTTPAELWRGLVEMRPGVGTVAELAGLEVTTGGAVAAYHDAGDRDTAMATRAIDDALAEAGRDPAATGLLWGTGLDTYVHVPAGEGRALQHRSAGACFAALAARFAAPRRMIALACATGASAIGEAFHLIRGGRAEAIVAGGSSAMLGRFYTIGFHALRAVAVDDAGEPASAACKPFDRRRRGFALADGAGALVVESLDSARRRGATPLAEIAGYGVSQDAYDLNRPPADGAGAQLAIQRALADAGCTSLAIDAVNAHGTGTLAGDLAETAAIRAVFGDRRVPVSSIKGAIGHAQAAAGALEAIAAIATCRTGVVPPTLNLADPDDACALDHVIGAPRELSARANPIRVLSTSFGMGGQNAALVIARYV